MTIYSRFCSDLLFGTPCISTEPLRWSVDFLLSLASNSAFSDIFSFCSVEKWNIAAAAEHHRSSAMFAYTLSIMYAADTIHNSLSLMSCVLLGNNSRAEPRSTERQSWQTPAEINCGDCRKGNRWIETTGMTRRNDSTLRQRDLWYWALLNRVQHRDIDHRRIHNRGSGALAPSEIW